jgi:hypothetical protein
MSAYLSSLTPVFTRHTYALRESIDVCRSSTMAIGIAAEPQCCCRSPPRFREPRRLLRSFACRAAKARREKLTAASNKQHAPDEKYGISERPIAWITQA